MRKVILLGLYVLSGLRRYGALGKGDRPGVNSTITHDGSVRSWLYRWLGIVHPAGAGFSRFSVNPEILDGLDWVKASLETVKGRIRVEWERRKGTLHLLVEVPVGSQAEIGIPCAGWGVIREGRACKWKDEAPGRPAAGVNSLERMGPRVRVRTGSGVYRFQAEL